MEEAALASELRALRPGHGPEDGPKVSVVVTNRDGRTHLERLLDGLDARTRYHNFELVLVDNGSTDDSIDLVQAWGGETHIVSNRENRSFSAANNMGVAAATGELVLLANNDLDPIDSDWLGYMVEALVDGVAAVGALLVYPTRPPREHPPAHPDMTVQHAGVFFETSQWGVRAANLGAGMDPLSIATPRVRDTPAVTAACLLARREDLLATPLDERYWYGSEDWDLSIRLGNRGRIVVDERAVLFHHEFGTQDRYMSEAWLGRRSENHRWFNAKWGPAIARRLRDEVTGDPSDWFFRGADRPVALIVGPNTGRAHDLSISLSAQAADDGWGVNDDGSKRGDLVIALEPPTDSHWFAGVELSVAVVTDNTERWARSGSLDHARRIVVPDATTQARVAATWGSGIAEITPELESGEEGVFRSLVARASPRAGALRIGVSTCAPDWEKAQFWGDTHLARGLSRAFRRLGHEASEVTAADWDHSRAANCDVMLHLRGLTRRNVARGQWNLLWIISHPDRIDAGEYDDYDIIASASESHAAKLSTSLGRPVHFMPQATDSDTFMPGPPDVDFEAPVLYVGNARWPARRAPRWLMRLERPFHLYGKNWDRQPEGRFVRGDYIDNRDLARAYRSASIVIADHHGSMRSNGFIANRIFDVLASGGFVLSDEVENLSTIFGDCIPTYADEHELEAQIRFLLADAGQRRRMARQGREITENGHTLDHRARQWLELLDAV